MADLKITNTASQAEIDADPVPFWQFSIARHGLVEGLRLASKLMSEAEAGNFCDDYETYHTATELMAVLAASLRKSTEP